MYSPFSHRIRPRGLIKPAILAVVVAVLASLLVYTSDTPISAQAVVPRIISNGVIQLGINPEGHLNVAGGSASSETGTTSVGLRYVPTNAEATAPGCLCEGWGVADLVSNVSGYANVATDGGAHNLTLESFEVNATSTEARSIVRVGTTYRVTHYYHPSPSPNLYQVDVKIENISAANVSVRYRRVMDWDIEPTAFNEFVTIQKGSASNIFQAHDNGFDTANPLFSAPGLNANFTDSGPADRGALFDFDFGTVAPGGTREFRTYYGAAGTEPDALAALAAVAAEAYSFGQPTGGQITGAPNTFIFAFTGIGGAPVVAAIETATTVTSSPIASSVGQPVTLTATVTADDATVPPAGTVQFKIDGAPVGGGVPLGATGTASLLTESIPAGAHDITAEYSGGTRGSGLDLVRYRSSVSAVLGHAVSVDLDGDGVVDSADNCATTPNPDQADTDHDGVGDACDSCKWISNPEQEGNACTLPGQGNGEQEQQPFPPGQNVQKEYRATVPGADEPETFVLGFDQVVTDSGETLVCSVNFRLVSLAEEAPRLAKLNAGRPADQQIQQLEYTTHDHDPRGFGIRYEVECMVDTTGDGVGDRNAEPGRDYNGVDLAFTFHAEGIQQFDIAQERSFHQPVVPGPWLPESDVPTFPVDQYDRLLSSVGPVHLAKSSCDCVGSASTSDLSWFIAVHKPFEDPDGDGPADPGEAALVPILPIVKTVAGAKTFWNPLRADGTFKPGIPIILTMRLKNTVTGAYIKDPNVIPPSESGLVATVKKIVDNDVDDNVALEGFLRLWGDDGAFLIDPLRQGYYTYVWVPVQQNTKQPLPPGKYAVTIASKYTAAQPFFITLK